MRGALAAATLRGGDDVHDPARPCGPATPVERVVRPEYIPVWMSKPIEALDDEKPVDLIRRGEYRRVAALISELEDPGAV